MIKGILLFLILSVNLFSTEERDPYPFYYINSFSKIKINAKSSELCRIKTKSVLNYSNHKKYECYKIEGKLNKVWKTVIEKKPKKKEITLLFFSKKGDILNPEIATSKGKFTVSALLYSKKDKTYYLEALDEKKKYFLFSIEPSVISLHE